MASTIRIIRDTDGVAHVRAPTLLGALEGQGFAAAQDRIWQMELDRRRALGRLAEVVGSPGLAADRLHRAMGLAEHARRSLASLGDEARDALDAYAAGINRYLATGPDLPAELQVLGIEPEPWEPWHSIALYEVRHLSMGTSEAKLWRSGLLHHLGAEAVARLWPSIEEALVDPDAPDQVVAVDAGPGMALGEELLRAFPTGVAADEQGSNNLAIAGDRTATGRPILAGDPHRAIDLPNVYWQNHLTCTDPDDPVDVIGLSFPGVPGFPHFGHNRSAAWCITHGMADDQDLFVVDLRRTADGVEHRHGDAWRAADVHVEQLPVAGGDPVDVEIASTHLGPVVADHEHDRGWTGLVLRWTATADVDTTFDALVPMLRASDVDDLDDAFAPWVVPVNNVLMADTAGTIAYRMRGRVAVRSEAQGWAVVDGADPAAAWDGFVADADLPRWRDPDLGFLVTSNNRVRAAGPYLSHDWAHPTRARRITALLGERGDWDVDDVSDLLGDTHSGVARALAGRLRALRPSDRREEQALGLLGDWDHHMDADSAAAALCGTVRAELSGSVRDRLMLDRDQLPGVTGPTPIQALHHVNVRLAWWIDDPELVPDDVLHVAVRGAIRSLEAAQGPDPSRWRWGAAHRSRWIHPLLALRPDLGERFDLPPSSEHGGDNECVLATSMAPPSTGTSKAQVARYVFDVGEWDRSAWIVPHGVSGDARSPHHLDQLDDWAGMRLRPMRFSAAAVDAATETTTELAGGEL